MPRPASNARRGSLDRLLVTGCAGFIGSNFVRYTLEHHPSAMVVGLDKLTYAGNLDNLLPIGRDARFQFVHGDICDAELIRTLVPRIDAIINFAAESHVDRSILNPDAFALSNFLGANTLLGAAQAAGVGRFVQISTDEVYGHIASGAATESALLAPRNPYAASKAGAELLAMSYFISYGLPVLVTRGSNTIGPQQYPEKVTPVYVTSALEGQPLPIYGQGQAVRDYLYVDDHCAAIDLVLRRGAPGEAYNVGAGEEVNTVRLATAILELLSLPRDLIQFVGDRPGHDYRYRLDTRKIEALGWRRRRSFASALALTVEWYRQNEWWWRKIKARGEYQEYYQQNYGPKILAASSPAG